MARADAPLQGSIFGTAEPARPIPNRHTVTPAGYAARPGSGPEGETCGTCQHCRAKGNRAGSRTFYKCGLMVRAWTCGRGSDVLLKSPACARWSAGKPRVTGIVR